MQKAKVKTKKQKTTYTATTMFLVMFLIIIKHQKNSKIKECKNKRKKRYNQPLFRKKILSYFYLE